MSAAFTHHGGRLAEAAAQFGGSPEQWLDLSTGINPVAWAPDPALSIDWSALPDTGALARLESTAAAHFGADPVFCGAVPGTEAGLRLLAQVVDLPGLCMPLAYRTYREAFGQGEALGSLAALPCRATALVLGNPNNPDGVAHSRAALLDLLAHQEAHGGWLIVDEAFADCDPAESVADLVAPGRGLIVLRSFGKFFGLAGLRLGFVIAPPAVLVGIRRMLGDWPVHSGALVLGTAAYADRYWIAETRLFLRQRAAELDAVLSRFGLIGQGGCPLFRLVQYRDAARLFTALARRQILTRPFADYPDLLRIGLPGDLRGLERLECALMQGVG